MYQAIFKEKYLFNLQETDPDISIFHDLCVSSLLGSHQIKDDNLHMQQTRSSIYSPTPEKDFWFFSC